MNYNTEKNNKVFIMGEVVSEATFSHEVYGEGFYDLNVRVMRLSGRRAQLLHGPSNRRAVMYYRHIRYLSRFTKAEIPEELSALAERAKFSQHKISPEELAQMQAHSDKLMQTRSLWQRFLYRMIYVIY